MVRALRESGVAVGLATSPDWRDRPVLLPRVVTRRPGVGYFHPVSASEIRGLLRDVGPEFTYGLSMVELRPGQHARERCFGRLIVPGRIVLYAQPRSPWLLPGLLDADGVSRLTGAGAAVTVSGGIQTTVEWPGETLRDFMLFDVLLHELGHHHAQQYGGKRSARIVRTRDHEAMADRIARDLRRLVT